MQEKLEKVLSFDPVVRDIHVEAPNNSNETHTFLCLGRAGHFGQH